jgi:energy-coupling factor transporter ATP-binding protein EcfA2
LRSESGTGGEDDGDVSDGKAVRPAQVGRDATVLSVRGLGKRFGDRVAFEGVSFEIGRGEVFGFLGPNGTGKTTTVRTLGTLIDEVTAVGPAWASAGGVSGPSFARRFASTGATAPSCGRWRSSPSHALALGLAGLLVVLDGLGWRVVASVFDRERMVTSTP